MTEDQMEMTEDQMETKEGYAEAGNVVKRADGRRYIARIDHPLPEGAVVVAAYPHEDGDFSYLCGKDWCRCMQ